MTFTRALPSYMSDIEEVLTLYHMRTSLGEILRANGFYRKYCTYVGSDVDHEPVEFRHWVLHTQTLFPPVTGGRASG